MGNAIMINGGGVSPFDECVGSVTYSAFPNGNDLILNLPSAKSIIFDNSVDFGSGKKLTINAPNLTSASGMLYRASGELDEIVLNADNITSLQSFTNSGSKVKVMRFSNTSRVTSWTNAFGNDVTHAYGIDYSSNNSGTTGFGGINIQFLDAVPNVLNCDISVGTYSLRNSSRQAFFAMVNVFKENAGKTLRKGSYCWTNRLETITGSSVLDETGTYHMFVDDGGTMTALDFLMNVKGWTVQ